MRLEMNVLRCSEIFPVFFNKKQTLALNNSETIFRVRPFTTLTGWCIGRNNQWDLFSREEDTDEVELKTRSCANIAGAQAPSGQVMERNWGWGWGGQKLDRRLTASHCQAMFVRLAKCGPPVNVTHRTETLKTSNSLEKKSQNNLPVTSTNHYTAFSPEYQNLVDNKFPRASSFQSKFQK